MILDFSRFILVGLVLMTAVGCKPRQAMNGSSLREDQVKSSIQSECSQLVRPLEMQLQAAVDRRKDIVDKRARLIRSAAESETLDPILPQLQSIDAELQQAKTENEKVVQELAQARDDELTCLEDKAGEATASGCYAVVKAKVPLPFNREMMRHVTAPVTKLLMGYYHMTEPQLAFSSVDSEIVYLSSSLTPSEQGRQVCQLITERTIDKIREEATEVWGPQNSWKERGKFWNLSDDGYSIRTPDLTRASYQPAVPCNCKQGRYEDVTRVIKSWNDAISVRGTAEAGL